MTHSPRPSTFRRFSLKPLPLALLLATASLPAFSQGFTGQQQVVGGTLTTVNGQSVFTATGKAGYIGTGGFGLGATESFTVNGSRHFNTLIDVHGSAASLIDGRITAAGGVWISNPNGIMFGANSIINVGSLVASSLTLDRDDFLNGRYLFKAAPGQGELAGQVVNKGRIHSPGGNIVLAGHQVTNEGLLSAPGGRVGLVASDEVLVDVEGDGLLFFNVKAGDAQTRLRQLGTIQADGGAVELMAAARGAFADTVLNMSGLVQARSVGSRNGQIHIDGGSTGSTVVTGTLDASGAGTGETGGQIKVLGAQVALAGQARLNASGDLGGGQVLVGGNVQGGGSERRAARSYVGKDVVIRADALRLGDGGKVVVWADGDTRYHGHISATGGAQGGNGGFTEVSGHEYLDYLGTVDLSAAKGVKGQLLLDPRNIEIVATTPESDINDDGTPGDDLGSATFGATTGAGGTSKISAAAIKTQLNTADVTLSATNDITVSAAIDASDNTGSHRLTLTASSGVGSGDIILAANITTRNGLTLNADNVILSGSAITLNAGNGTMVINAPVDGGGQNLTLISANAGATAIDLQGAVSNVAALTVQGKVRIDNDITSTGTQSYEGTVVLGSNSVELNAGAGKISLAGAVNGNGENLTLVSSHADADAITTGSTLSAAAFTVTGKASLGGNVTTTGTQSYSSTVALSNTATLNAGTGKISVAGAVTGNGHDLTLQSSNVAGDAIKLQSTVSGVKDMTVTGRATLGGDVTTTGAQSYANAIELDGSDVTLNAGAQKIALNGTVNGDGRNLTLQSTHTDADAIKTAAAITNVVGLTVTGKSTLGGNVTTTGDQTYSGDVKLGSAAVTLDAGASKINLAGAVDGSTRNLTLKSTHADANAISTGSTVSNVAVLTVTGKSTLGGNVTTTGNQEYDGALTLGSSAVTLDAGANKVALKGAVDGNAQNLTLASTHADADAISTTSTVSNVAALTVTGKSTLGGNVTTTGNQTYNGALALGSNPATLNAGASKIALNGAVNGNARNLTLVSTHADADAIRTTSTVASVAQLTMTGKSTLGGNVTTTGNQSYSELVTLGANTTLNAGANKIALTAGVDGNGRTLGLSSSHADADAIQTAAISGVSDLTVTGRATLSGDVSTTATQTYNGKLTLGSNATLHGTSLSLTDLDATGRAVGLHTNALAISGTVTGTGTSTATFERFTNTGAISVANGLPVGANTLQLSQATLNKFQNFASITIGNSASAYAVAFGDFMLPTTTIVRSSSGNISFGKLDGAKALDAQTSGIGTISLNDVVGGTDRLGSVLLNGAITLNTASVRTTGNQTYTGAVTLGSQATTTLDAGAGKVAFTSTVDGNGRNLALTSSNADADAISTASTVSNVAALTVTGKSTLGGNVTSTGNQTYTDLVKLDSSAATLDAGAGKIALNGGVDGSSQNLTLKSTNSAADAIKTGGALASVAALTVTGKSTIGANVTTSGNQTYSGALTLGADATLSGAALNFNSTINGAHALVLSGTTVTFGGAVGNTTALSSLSVTAPGGIAVNGGGVTTTGDQTYQNAVTLGAAPGVSTTFSGDTLRFNGGLAAGSNDLTLRIGSGLSVTGGVTGTGNAAIAAQSDASNITVGAVTADPGDVEISNATLSAFGAGFASLTVGTASGTGSISFGNYTLTRNLQVRTGSGDISFGMLDGGHALSAESTSGVITLGGNVGGGSLLSQLTLTGNVRINAGYVQTTGSQLYDGDVTLGNHVGIYGGQGVRFTGTVDSAAANNYELTVQGYGASGVQFEGAVGQTQALSNLYVYGSTASVNGHITTTGYQEWNLPVVLAGATHFRAPDLAFYSSLTAGTHALGLFSTYLYTNGAVTGTGELLLGADQDSVSLGVLGGAGTAQINTGVLNNLLAGGFTSLTIGNATGTGAVTVGTSTADNLQLTTNLTLQSGSGDITILSQVNGGFNLTVNTSGVTTLSSSMGNSSTLASVTTDAGGSTRLGGTVNTTGNQTYLDNVTLTGSASLNTNPTSTVRFGGTVDGQSAGGQTLLIYSNAQFDGAVGAVNKLANFGVLYNTQANGGSVSTTGYQIYAGNVTLGGDLAAASDGSYIRFAGTVNGAHALNSTSGVGSYTQFSGAVGSGTALTSLTTAGGSTLLNGGTVTTTGDQSYTAATLGANTTLTGQNISLAGAQGPHSLALVASGTSTLSGPVGTTTVLNSLSTSGATTLNGGAITTSGAQTYGGAVTLGANTTINGNTVGFNSTVNGTVNGAQALVVNDSGTTTFGGNVGGTTALASLSTSAGGNTVLPASVRTTGAQNYGDAVTLSANTVLAANGVTVANLIGAGHSLQITSAGETRFNGTATGLSSFTSDGAGEVLFVGQAGLNTAGLQAYTGTVRTALSNASFSGSALTFANGLTSTGTNLSLSTNQLTLAGGLVGNGTLTLATNTAGTSIGLAGGTGTLQLTQAMLNQVAGFGQQVIGRTDGTGAVRVGALTLNRGTTVQSGTGSVTFTDTVDGGQALTVDTDGLTAFQGNVGSTTALSSLTVTGASSLSGSSVTTTGAQSYGGALSYSSTPTTLTASSLSFGAGASGGTDLTLVADALSLTGSLSGSGVLSLRPTTAATTIGLAGGVGTLQISQALLNQVGGFASQLIGRADGSGAINAGTLTLGRSTTVQSSSGAITFNSTVDGAHALAVNTTGLTTFNGDVGATTALASLSTNAGGGTRLNGSQVRTTGAQSYGDALVYTGAATFRASALHFALGATGGTDLTLISNTLSFGGAVSGTGTLSIQQALQGGTIGIAGGTGTLQLTQAMLNQVAGFGQRVIGSADGTGAITANDVTLSANTTVQSATGNISFARIDGPTNLVVNTGGTTAFGSDIGATTRLSSLTTDSVGSTTIESAVIRTTGNVQLGDAVNVAGPLTIDATAAGNVTALNTNNEFEGTLTLTANNVELFSHTALELAGATLAAGGQITTDGLLTLSGDITQTQAGGSLTLTTNAAPGSAIEFTDADLTGTPRFFNSLVLKEASATIRQTGGRVSTAAGSRLSLQATQGGSISVEQVGNTIEGQVSAVTAGSSDFNGSGTRALSFVRLNSSTVAVGGAGIQADAVKITADRLSTAPGSVIRARLPYNNALGVETALPALTLVLSPAALAAPPSSKAFGGLLEADRIQIDIGDGTYGAFLTVRPKGGAALGQGYISLGGPVSVRPFYDGSGKLSEIPVYYNGEVPQSPQEVGALSAVSAVIEEARRSRFEEAVRTENVALRLRSGVIAEVGAGRPATEGSDSIRMPESCTPAANGLSCQ